MADPFLSPYTTAGPSPEDFDITPHATNELPSIPRGVYVGGAGNLVVRLMNSTADRTYYNVAAGTILPIRAKYVRATSTATNLVGLL